MAKIIAKNNWDFILYEIGNNYIISVVFFNNPIDTSKYFILLDNEKTLNFEELKKLSQNIRDNYESYKLREVSPPV